MFIALDYRATCPLTQRPDISQYLDRLDADCQRVDLHHINACRAWGPKRPNASEREQASFLAACDAGVGVSDQHAQSFLNYARTREGPWLPKSIKTCWKNVEKAHAKMCGTIHKVKVRSM